MFKIESISAGWIMGEIGDGRQQYVFDYSYISDFMNDFMKALLSATGEWEDYSKWYDELRGELEPAIDVWNVRRKSDELIIDIRNYEDSDSDIVEDEITLTFVFDEFLKEVVQALENVMQHYGFVGYRESWGYEFPIGMYLMLKNICHGKTKLTVNEESENQYGLDETVSDFDKELELLKEK